MVAARSRDGKVECFEVTENEHRDHILKTSRVPAKVTPALARDARQIATRIAKAFDYVGVLAVEMFVVRKGRKHALLVNEIAPRVHNSGHWTIDGATVSQFEQHIRAVAGWPLAKPIRLGRRVEMVNLIGAEVNDAARWLSVPGASVHVYGKGEARPRRKMGHVTRVLDSAERSRSLTLTPYGKRRCSGHLRRHPNGLLTPFLLEPPDSKPPSYGAFALTRPSNN